MAPLKSSIVNKAIIFLTVAMCSMSAMSLEVYQTKRLAYQGYAIPQSNPEVTSYQEQSTRDIERAQPYQRNFDKGEVRSHTVFAINITIDKICVKIISRKASCIKN